MSEKMTMEKLAAKLAAMEAKLAATEAARAEAEEKAAAAAAAAEAAAAEAARKQALEGLFSGQKRQLGECPAEIKGALDLFSDSRKGVTKMAVAAWLLARGAATATADEEPLPAVFCKLAEASLEEIDRAIRSALSGR